MTGAAVGNVENFGDNVEKKWDGAVDDVENFPENAAQWTGEKVQGVENTWDNAVDDVENFPESVAEWTGEKVQDVENWGGDMEEAYDQGREEARDDDYCDDY